MLFILGLALVLATLVDGIRTPYVDIGPQDQKEDAALLYSSIVESTAEYEATKRMGQRGLVRGDDHICYPDHGCYYKNGTSSNFWALPHPPEYINTKFYLYTSGQQRNPQMITYSDPTTIINSDFQANKPTTVLIHGFGNSANTDWMPAFQKAVFRGQPEGNYILVDWGIGAKPPNYWSASANTQIVGTIIAKMICTINSNLGTNSSSFHLVGYSLGAHVAGFTARRLEECGHRKVGRITALDPAGPIFDSAHDDSILSKHDADFVTGIHGNGVSLVYGGFGLEAQVGHIDFYPNGGQYQPGCDHPVWGTLGNLLTFNFGDMPESVKCNHHRAIDLAIESVDAEMDCSFTSYPCDKYADFQDGKCLDGPTAKMGLFAINQPSEKRHFLLTKEKHAFCSGVMKVTFEIAKSSPKSSGALFVTFVGKSGVVDTVEQVSPEDGDLLPGMKVVELVASRIKPADLTEVHVKYEPECGWIYCSPERIHIEELTIETPAGQRETLCAGFSVLFKGDTVKLPLSKC